MESICQRLNDLEVKNKQLEKEINELKSNSTSSNKRQKQKVPKPPKPPSAYNLYMKDKLKELKETHPNMSHKEVWKAATSAWSEAKTNLS